jgi:hypothetical protein
MPKRVANPVQHNSTGGTRSEGNVDPDTDPPGGRILRRLPILVVDD